ncbi:MAG: TetR/AcrR family transcriptional regulator [Arenicellales bacterium]|nr:TetR/AcrR family transcriptional regulator [Arenicellales bacterium]
MKDRIVDAALELAESGSWEGVRLHHIAQRLGISLEQVRQEFREKEEIVDAWFDRADQAMLESVRNEAAKDLGREELIHLATMCWLNALEKHRKPTRQMIFNKFEFGHLHYQVSGAMRVSRTVQWIREVAGLEDELPWRAFSEAGLTTIFLATFFYWMFDSSDHSEKTEQFLKQRLENARPIVRVVKG